MTDEHFVWAVINMDFIFLCLVLGGTFLPLLLAAAIARWWRR
jgi:hypothetical protein